MGNYRNFRLATYFVAKAAARITREELEDQLAFFERYLRLDKVYLEPWRGLMASSEQIRMIQGVLRDCGIEVEGGLTTVIPTPEGAEPKPRMFETFCYNDPGMREKLREVSAFMGRHFRRFMLDDFFFTDCTCADCIRERDAYNKVHGITDGSWKAYRLDLMRRVTEEDIIAPARRENPDCQVVIKYPNWAESYQETGYNPRDQRKIIDGLYTGTETRDPVTTDQHLPRYLSFSLMTYFENMWPGHNGGGWFDNFDTHITEHYLEQAYLPAFSKPKELMMFCFQSLYNHMYIPALGFQLDRLDAVLDHAGSPVGICTYLPDNCEGEDHVQDFLGMNGLPVVLTPYFPENAPQILLTRSSACDPEIVDRLEAYVRRGGTALVTTGFLDAVSDRGISRMTSLRLNGRHVQASRFRVEEDDRDGWPACTFPESAQPVTLPVPEFRNNATWAVIKAVHGEESFGLFLRDRYGKGVMYTLAVPDARPDMYNLPSGVLSRMRQALAVNGIWMEGPSRISLFVYDNDTFIVYPYVMDGVQRTCIRLHVSGAKALEIPVGNRTLEPLYTQHGEAIFEVPAMPGDYMLYRIIR